MENKACLLALQISGKANNKIKSESYFFQKPKSWPPTVPEEVSYRKGIIKLRGNSSILISWCLRENPVNQLASEGGGRWCLHHHFFYVQNLSLLGVM